MCTFYQHQMVTIQQGFPVTRVNIPIRGFVLHSKIVHSYVKVTYAELTITRERVQILT